MIVTKPRISTRLPRPELLEGWVERVDAHNRRLHVRTGSRDRHGSFVLVPEGCEIHHEGYRLGLQSLLPCDAVNIHYTQDADGTRVAHSVELSA